MVFYECLITTRNTTNFTLLTAMMKKLSHEVVDKGGVVRSIHNHGVRLLPHPFKCKYPDAEGKRRYKKGRMISFYYESSPLTMRYVESTLKMNEEVLRNIHVKARSNLDFVNIEQMDRNYFVQQVLKEEAKERVVMKQVNETVEQVIDDMRDDN